MISIVGGSPALKRRTVYLSIGGLAVVTCCVPSLMPPSEPGPPRPPPTATASEAPVQPPAEPPKCEYTTPPALRAPRTATRIVGGKPSQEGAWPSAVALATAAGVPYCTGTLIRPDRVLTAAHCTAQTGETVLVGSTDLSKATRLTITENRTHPAYDAWTSDLDVAILRLHAQADVETVGLAQANYSANEIPDAIVVGWGATREGGSMVAHLREVSVPRWLWEDCRDAYSTLTRNQTCAGIMGRDSCQGDSGGPLFAFVADHWEQIGITSFGHGCARDGYPGVYTAVFSEAVSEWIEACAQ